MKKFSQFLKEDNDEVATHKPVVFSFARMNPPTPGGHGQLVNTVKKVAKQYNAPHEIVLSHTQDADKNPLTPEQKLTHAKRIFPDANLSMASGALPTLMHHAARLSSAGHDHLIMVAGGDRVPEYQRLLNAYNGKPDKTGKVPFHFKKISVVSAGDRDPDGEADPNDPKSISASKIRGLVASGNKEEFMKHYPNMHPQHAEELYNDLASGMVKPKKR